MPECLFCKIIKGEIPSHKIYEDEKTFAFLDIGPVTKGHTLVIPKEHAKDWTSGSEESAIDVMRTVYKITPKIVTALDGSGYNLGMNVGADAGQLVFHTHVHVMPRYRGTPRTFQKTHPSHRELKSVADIIKREIEK